jgi:hypothetical protein
MERMAQRRERCSFDGITTVKWREVRRELAEDDKTTIRIAEIEFTTTLDGRF